MPSCLRRARARSIAGRVTTRALASLTTAALAATVLVTGLAGPGASHASAAGSRTATAIKYALHQLGDPYRYGASGPRAFDCSGLTRAAYGAAGVYLPHSSRYQYRYGAHIRHRHWRPGDLIFWATHVRKPRSIYHVGIFLGGGKVLHAPHTGDVVRIDPIWSRTHLMRYAARPTGRYSKAFRPVGTTGPAVKAVQLRLRANGYRLRVSGYFNDRTRTAVRRFKSRTGLAATSEVTAPAWRHLVRYGLKARLS